MEGGPSDRAWPLLLLLVAAVLVPTAGLLWFMGAAMRNERLAVKQKLEQAYRPALTEAAHAVRSYWAERRSVLERAVDQPPARAFATVVRSGAARAAVVLGESGQVLYPAAEPDLAAATLHPALAEAARLEFALDQPRIAAIAYRQVAERAGSPDIRAQALMGQARCLLKVADTAEAIRLLVVELQQPDLRRATGTNGRLIAPAALLRALQVMEPGYPSYRQTLDEMVLQLRDYDNWPMSSAERRFLMRRVLEIAPQVTTFDTLEAEELASEFVARHLAAPEGAGLAPSAMPGTWQFTIANSPVVALLERAQTLRELEAAVAQALPHQLHIAFVRPGVVVGEEPFLLTTLDESMPGWRLAAYLRGEDPLASRAEHQVATYLWTGLLLVGLVAGTVLLVGRAAFHQMKLARLKNDFIATVTHELKTPLCSMRVLVDTLLEGNYRDQRQVREYLELMARENERLSRLIDNFLSFSRMERNKQAFSFRPVEPRELVEAAADIVRERFEAVGCAFTAEANGELPAVEADRDALVTVLLNLLDNAYKYSTDDKRIALRAFADDGEICFQVQDNGIGMRRRAVRRAFDRFYQVDQSLSRSVGGCGLGLSIVKFIVEAHGGSVDVESRPGEGSTFTVRLPAAQGNGARRGRG